MLPPSHGSDSDISASDKIRPQCSRHLRPHRDQVPRNSKPFYRCNCPFHSIVPRPHPPGSLSDGLFRPLLSRNFCFVCKFIMLFPVNIHDRIAPFGSLFRQGASAIRLLILLCFIDADNDDLVIVLAGDVFQQGIQQVRDISVTCAGSVLEPDPCPVQV